MRKLWIFLLSLAVLLCAAVPAGAADGEDPIHRKIIESYYSDEVNDLEVLGVLKQDSLAPVDIRQWRLTQEELKQIYEKLYYGGKLPWFAGMNYSVQYTDNGITSFTPMVLDAQVYDRDLYEQEITELMAETCLPGMTDWQKALSVHDYIVLHTVYDETYENETGYDALVNGTAVCSGYAALYMDVMNRLGIPCQMVVCEDTGNGEGHGWNLLQLQGQWYHVDLTWDDPTPDTYGSVSHDHFLKTDEEFLCGENPHDFGWEALEETAQEPYIWDDFLDDSVSAFCFVDATTAVCRTAAENSYQIRSVDLTTGEETLLYEFEFLPMDLGDGTHWYPTRGISIWNGRIYFNREDAVISILPDGSDVQVVYGWYPEDQYIFGSFVDDGVLYLTLADSEFNRTSVEVELEGVEYHVHSYEAHMVEATCQKTGFSEQVCSCGISYNYQELPAVDHLWEYEVIKESTREECGLLYIHCDMCGAEEWEDLSPLPSTAEMLMGDWISDLPMVACGALVLLILVAIIRKKRR